jgi:hypothetical protein
VAEVGGGFSFASVDVKSGFVRVPAARLSSWSMPHRKHGVKTRVAFVPYGRFRGGLSVLTPCLRRGAGVVRAGRQRPGWSRFISQLTHQTYGQPTHVCRGQIAKGEPIARPLPPY